MIQNCTVVTSETDFFLLFFLFLNQNTKIFWKLQVSCIYCHLPCSKLTPLCNVVPCVLLQCLCVIYWNQCCCVFFSPHRSPWSLCQGCRGRFRAMPLNRHCEEHTWPQVESTLWPVSPRDFNYFNTHAVISDICFQKEKNPFVYLNASHLPDYKQEV